MFKNTSILPRRHAGAAAAGRVSRGKLLSAYILWSERCGHRWMGAGEHTIIFFDLVGPRTSSGETFFSQVSIAVRGVDCFGGVTCCD